MRRRHGLAALLAESNLAERDLERERIRAARDAQNFATGANALRSLVPAAADLANKYGDRVNEEAALEGQALLGENLSATGDAKETPEQLASRLVGGRKTLDTGDVGFDPLGFKAHARKTASVKAQGALAQQIKGNRDDAAKLARAATEKEAERKHALDLVNARNTAKEAVEVPDDEADQANRSMRMARGFAKIQDDQDAEAVDAGARANRMDSALDNVSDSLEQGTDLSKGATEASKREERRLQMLARIATDPKKRAALDDEAWEDLASIGIMKPKAQPSTGAGPGPRPLTDKERKAKALADAAEARARSAKVKADNDENPTQKPPNTKEKGKQRQIASAKHLLDEIERTHKEYAASTSLPATGRGVGFVRSAFTGVVPGMEESKRAKFLANSEGLNAMLFPILGREDAPADAETKRLAPLRIDENTTDDELAAKLATLRGMITAQEHALNMGGAMSGAGAQPSDRVLVTNGAETLRIPRARLADAEADGFREVQR